MSIVSDDQPVTPHAAPSQDPCPRCGTQPDPVGACRCVILCQVCGSKVIPFLPGQRRHLWDHPDGGTLPAWLESRTEQEIRQALSELADQRLTELEQGAQR